MIAASRLQIYENTLSPCYILLKRTSITSIIGVRAIATPLLKPLSFNKKPWDSSLRSEWQQVWKASEVKSLSSQSPANLITTWHPNIVRDFNPKRKKISQSTFMLLLLRHTRHTCASKIFKIVFRPCHYGRGQLHFVGIWFVMVIMYPTALGSRSKQIKNKRSQTTY